MGVKFWREASRLLLSALIKSMMHKIPGCQKASGGSGRAAAHFKENTQKLPHNSERAGQRESDQLTTASLAAGGRKSEAQQAEPGEPETRFCRVDLDPSGTILCWDSTVRTT